MPKGLLTISVVNDEDFAPIKGANITLYFIDKNNKKIFIADDLYTNESGQVRKICLYAPNRMYSEMPGNKLPYSKYAIEVNKEGFEPFSISGVQVFAEQQSIQVIKLRNKKTKSKSPSVISEGANAPNVINIGENVLVGNDPPKEIEPEKDSSTFILKDPVVPEYIIVHDGLPTDKNATDYWIYFSDYIKNVASSEIYSTWPTSTIYANVIAIISFTLNRVYTEWYKNQGYRFTITSTTQYDHKFIYGRNTFESIDRVVDDIFNTYIRRDNKKAPLLAQYCDGKNTQCPGVMTQWGSKYLGDQGYSYPDILKYYYGNNINFTKAPVITGIPTSYAGYSIGVGDRGEYVKGIQILLNGVSKAYPAIPKVSEDGIFGSGTEKAVKEFQKIFNLAVDGIVGFSTWYELSRVYTAVNKLGAYQP